MKTEHLKFRPVLNLIQLTRIADLVSQSDSYVDKSIKKVIVPMISKIEVGAINPAYSLSESYLQKQSAKSEQERYESGTMSPEEEAKYENKILGLGV